MLGRFLLVPALLLLWHQGLADDPCATWQAEPPPGPIYPMGDILLNPIDGYFSWEQANLETCYGVLDEIYQVLAVPFSENTLIAPNDPVLCQVNASSTCTPDASLLSDDVRYQWVPRLVTNASNPEAGFMSTEFNYGVFVWCVPVPPDPALLNATMSANNTFKFREEIDFEWEVPDFGKPCDSTKPPTLIIVITSLETNATVEEPLLGNVASYSYQPSLQGDLLPGNYTWRIVSSNLYFNIDSEEVEFLVLPPDPIPCAQCVENQGTCNTTVGICVCLEGFYGAGCSLSSTVDVPTTTPPYPLIIGLSVAGGVVVLIIVVMVVLFVIYRKRHEDVEMNILIEPPEFGVLAFEPYSLAPTPFLEANAKKGSWRNLEQAILAEDFILTQAIINSAKIVNMDLLCSSFVVVYESHAAGSSFVQRLMIRELIDFKPSRGAGGNEANPMPYRGDSAATKAFKVYCRLLGLPYLFETLGQILNDFCALLDEGNRSEADDQDNKSTTTLPRKATLTPASMEVDPNRMTSEEDETINRLSLQLICQKIFVKVNRSLNIFPVEIRQICKKIKDESAKLESLRDINTNVLISNLVFLRFINPAIIMPKNFGLIKDEPSDGAKRQLVLITKVLQNLAAGVEFGKKESFMAKLNDFIRANSGQMTKFLTELTDKIDNTSPPQIAVYSAPISQLHYNAALANLYDYMFSHQQEIQAAIRAEASPNKAEQVIKSMEDLIEEFGNPASYGKK